MLKLALLGVWVIIVTASATLGSVYVKTNMNSAVSGEKVDAGVEELKADMTSVPMIRNGEIVGYLIIQLSFQADRAVLDEKKLEPMPYLNDAAFRVIFAHTDIDYRRMREADLTAITDGIAKEANATIGAELVRQVLIQQLNFVRKEDIRTNWIGNGNAGQ